MLDRLKTGSLIYFKVILLIFNSSPVARHFAKSAEYSRHPGVHQNTEGCT